MVHVFDGDRLEADDQVFRRLEIAFIGQWVARAMLLRRSALTDFPYPWHCAGALGFVCAALPKERQFFRAFKPTKRLQNAVTGVRN